MRIKNISKHIKLLRAEGLSVATKYKLHKDKRYVPSQIKLFGQTIQLLDAHSFIEMFHEIFIERHYQFRPHRNQPIIIDCGANIGLSTIFFKRQYPNADITAIEADPNIYKILQSNVLSYGYEAISLKHAAVWVHNDGIRFVSEGGTSGRISTDSGEHKIPTIRLKDILKKYQGVDMLKIDIEGAEMQVLSDCEDQLYRVHNLFVEYHSFEKKEQSLDHLLNILTKAGFRYHIKEAYTTEQPFLNRKLQQGMDLQLNIFAYR